MNKCGLALLLAGLALLVASCGSRLLVPGLTLPPGSAEVSFVSDATGENLPDQMPMLGEVKREVIVTFNNENEWETIASQVNKCMTSAGYSETMEALSQDTDEMAIPLGMQEKVKQTLNDKLRVMMRCYTKPGGKYAVLLINNNWTRGMAASAGVNPDMIDDGLGDYMLAVVEFKPK